MNAEQIYDKHLIHIPDFINRRPHVLAAIQEALDIKEKELQELREDNKRLRDDLDKRVQKLEQKDWLTTPLKNTKNFTNE